MSTIRTVHLGADELATIRALEDRISQLRAENKWLREANADLSEALKQARAVPPEALV